MEGLELQRLEMENLELQRLKMENLELQRLEMQHLETLERDTRNHRGRTTNPESNLQKDLNDICCRWDPACCDYTN